MGKSCNNYQHHSPTKENSGKIYLVTTKDAVTLILDITGSSRSVDLPAGMTRFCDLYQYSVDVHQLIKIDIV